MDISYPAAIINWLEAPIASKETAYSIVTVLSSVGFGRGIFPLNLIVNQFAFTFLGVGMDQSSEYPRWMGWGGLFLGVTGLALGIIMKFTG